MAKIAGIDDVNSALEILGRQDPLLSEAHKFVLSAGLEVPLRLRPGGFTGLSEIVVSQLVSKASASAIFSRMIEIIDPFDPVHCIEASDKSWRQIGMSRAKQATLCAIAQAILERVLVLEQLENLPVEQSLQTLTRIKGVGPWTAEVYLLFCVGHPDIFPAGDLALREAARLIWQDDERPPAHELKEKAIRWAPHRGTAARLLWAYYAAKKRGKDAMP